MKTSHALIIIRGLGDDTWILSRIIDSWRKYNFFPILYDLGWYDEEKLITPKLSKLLKFIDKLTNSYGKISILGYSAGASVAFNAFCERPRVLYKVVNICGRLRPGKHFIRSLDHMSVTCPSFKSSVLLFSQKEKDLKEKDRKRMMTVRAMFGDELVPWDTTTLTGAQNIFIPTIEHTLSIYMALTVFSDPIIKFLQS